MRGGVGCDLLGLVALVLAALFAGCADSARGGGSPTDPSRWSWLAENGGTYWYVPAENLLAYRWDSDTPQTQTAVSDQTVWHIERYDNGYFFGPVAVQFGDDPRICQYAIGSITPEGRVYISFNAVQEIPAGSPSITTGTGRMVRVRGEWTFNMQMASGASSTEVTHWAYMLQCTPDEECWNDLPGIDESVTDFLASCT